MRLPALLAAVLVLGLARAPARAERADPPPIRFAEDLGFKDFLSHEPEETPRIGLDRSPHVQKPLFDVREWRERTAPKFAIHVSGSEYYLGASLGRNLIGRFYRSGFGTELTGFLHLDKGVDVFLSFSYGWHDGNRGEVLGEAAKLSDYNSYEFLVGVRPYIGLGSLLGVDDAGLNAFRLGFRLGAGPAVMQSVKRIRPPPETDFWDTSALGTIHASLGLEAALTPSLSVFLDHGVRFFTAPSPSSSGRPGNETGPYFYAIWQAGFFLRF